MVNKYRPLFYYYDGSGWLVLRASTNSTLADADSDTKIQLEEGGDEDTILI
ncbi:MAG: hypothetical protein IH946_09040 [Bacteroidetes bacterium]|nr:hypothetical protein [Bacteroidota bacterium]